MQYLFGASIWSWLSVHCTCRGRAEGRETSCVKRLEKPAALTERRTQREFEHVKSESTAVGAQLGVAAVRCTGSKGAGIALLRSTRARPSRNAKAKPV